MFCFTAKAYQFLCSRKTTSDIGGLISVSVLPLAQNADLRDTQAMVNDCHINHKPCAHKNMRLQTKQALYINVCAIL